MRFFVLLLTLSCLFNSCSSGTDWKEQFSLAEKEVQEWWRNAFVNPEHHCSDPHYINAISLLDDIIKNSPDYRNQALAYKTSVLFAARNYDEAIKTIGMIPDTSSVFFSFRTKSIWMNQILHEKASIQGNSDEALTYKRNILHEMEVQLEHRRDSLYSSISSMQGIGLSPITDENVFLLLMYLEELKGYDMDILSSTIQRLETEDPIPNHNSKEFFRNLRERML